MNLRILQWPLLLLCLSGVASARPVDFDLPAQPVVRSLVQFSRQAKAEVLFSHTALERLSAQAVKGRYEPRVALELLLAGTACTFTETGTGKFVVVAPAPEPAHPARPEKPAPAPEGAALTDEAVQLERLVVTPGRFSISDDPALPGATLTHREIAALPQLGEDLFRTVSWVPGVTASDFSAKFWLRGAPNGKVLTRLDGVTLLEPFHMKDIDGVLTVLDLEAIGSLDLVTGGLTADYGDRLAGALTLESIRPEADQPRHTLGVSLTGVRFTTCRPFASGRGSWLLSARSGYPDFTLRMVHGEEIRPRYHDAFGKFDFEIAPGQRIAVSVLHAYDTLSYAQLNRPDLFTRYADDYLWLRWQARIGPGVQVESVLSQSWLGWHRNSLGTYSDLDRTLGLRLRDDRQLSLTTLRQDWNVELAPAWLFRGGVEAARGLAEYDYDGSHQKVVVNGSAIDVVTTTRVASLRNRGNSFGTYVSLRTRPVERLLVEAGARYDRQNYAGGANLTPRLNAVLDLGKDSFRAAWGRYRQASGLHEIEVADGETAYASAELATQAVLGWEHRSPGGAHYKVELYRRETTAPRPYWTNLVSALSVLPEFEAERARMSPQRQLAQGVELSVSRRMGGTLRWSAAYTLARAEEEVDGRRIPVSHDQRHTLQANLAWSPTPRWDISASWQYHTGWPVTEMRYEQVALPGGGVSVILRPGAPFGRRVPAYHRLDLRATRTFRLPHSQMRVYADVFNAYNSDNVFRYRLAAQWNGRQFQTVVTPIKSLPLLPSVGVAWDF